MSKHTPGPWEVGQQRRFEELTPRWIIRPEGEFPHGLWIADGGWIGHEETEANARLIAAAPDLLAALKEAVEVAPLGTTKVAKWMGRAGNAIDKAEGKR